MKKTYIIPATEVTILSLHESLLGTSDPKPNVTLDRDGSVDAASVEVKGSASYNVWSDDWSE